MIKGVGVDVVNIGRMRRWEKIEGLLDRYFHPEELKAAKTRGSASTLSLAARFAAKEAFGKALGTGLKGLQLKDIQVVNNHNGKPDILVYNKAYEAFKSVGGEVMHLSLTHEQDYAIAMVVIEG